MSLDKKLVGWRWIGVPDGVQAGSSARKVFDAGGGGGGGVSLDLDDLGGGGGGGSDAGGDNMEYLSIWPRGAADAVMESFSFSGSGSVSLVTAAGVLNVDEAGILGVGGTVSTPQLTGLRLISVFAESFAVAGAKKL